MTRISIACYEPKEDKEEDLKTLVKEHWSILYQQHLVTDRKAIVMQAKNGTIIEIFEWASAEAIDQAHSNQAVMVLWARFNELCNYVAPNSLEECHHIFPGFRTLD